MNSKLILRAALAFSVAALAHAQAATTIDVSNAVAVSSVKRFGINLGALNYFDSGQIMKQLVFRNPGFEPLMYQSVIRCASGTATNCVDDITSTNPAAPPFTVWPTGFWNGAGFEVIWGTAKGRTGTVVSSTAPSGGNGTSYQFADSGIAPAAGDFIALRKTDSGDATNGWMTGGTGGSITTETNDLALDAQGRQAARLTATNSGQSASVTASFETGIYGTFLQLNGNFLLGFKAKGAGGGNQLNVRLTRAGATTTTFINQTNVLSAAWSNYNIAFNGAENGSATGTVSLRFTAINQSAALLDEINLRQTNSDPANTTAFRDPVVTALKSFNPGLLRNFHVRGNLGDSLDNQLAAPFARLRSGFATVSTSNDDLDYGLHEFLELCEAVGTEPWFSFPITFSTSEITNLLEYLGGATNTIYGAKRFARGHAAPWTNAFAKIHLEFGNEAWNSGAYSGGTIDNPTAYGNRGNELYGAARASPWFSGAKFELVLGGRAVEPSRNLAINNASTNHDTLCVGPYFAQNVDADTNNEVLFGPLFAEPEMMETTGNMRQNFDTIQGSARPVPLSVYEVNLQTAHGAITQAALNSFTPSLGAGLAVADHMLMMQRDLGITNQMVYSLTEYVNPRDDGKTMLLWGVVRDMGVTDRKRPQYLALQLANEAMTGDAVRTTHSGDNPTWNQPAINSLQTPFTNAHYLQSFAFSSNRTKSLIVFNLNRTNSLSVNFSGANAPTGSVTLKQLTSANLTDNNENSNTVAVTTQPLTNFNPAQNFSLPAFSMSVLQWQVVSQPPQFISTERLTNGAVRLSLTVTPGLTYILQGSSNLVDWVSSGSTNASGSQLEFTDPDAALLLQRFYRAVQPP